MSNRCVPVLGNFTRIPQTLRDELKGELEERPCGQGRAVALLYAREGADVAIVYLPYEQPDAEETQRVVEEQGRTCLLLPGDLCDPDFCREVVAQTVRRFGRLNILINNAASKAALVAFTKSIAPHLAERGVRANIVAPGPTWTVLNNSDDHMPREGLADLGSEARPWAAPPSRRKSHRRTSTSPRTRIRATRWAK